MVSGEVSSSKKQNDAKKPEKMTKPQRMGTHLRVLSESYPVNTNMTGSRWFSKKKLTTGRVKICFGAAMWVCLPVIDCDCPVMMANRCAIMLVTSGQWCGQ